LSSVPPHPEELGSDNAIAPAGGVASNGVNQIPKPTESELSARKGSKLAFREAFITREETASGRGLPEAQQTSASFCAEPLNKKGELDFRRPPCYAYASFFKGITKHNTRSRTKSRHRSVSITCPSRCARLTPTFQHAGFGKRFNEKPASLHVTRGTNNAKVAQAALK
jgi:hypothetical protein